MPIFYLGSECLLVTAHALESLGVILPFVAPLVSDLYVYPPVPISLAAGVHNSYGFDVILAAVAIERRLKVNDDTLMQVVFNAVAINAGFSAACQFRADMASGRARLPNRTTLQAWAVKLDLVLSLFHRQFASSPVRMARHGSADSSPQAGYNYLCPRDEIMIRASICDSKDFGFQWHSHKLIVSVLGLAKTAE
jgi:hypothetical protein